MRLPALLLGLLAVGPALAQLEDWTPLPVPHAEGWKGEKGFGWYRACVNEHAAVTYTHLTLPTNA